MTKILYTLINLLLVSTLVAQNVGINNADPQATLDINGDVRYRSFQLNLSGSLHNDLDLTTNKFSVYTVLENTQIMPSLNTEDLGRYSVLLSGNHILVGDPKHLSSTNFGAAYFYKRQ